MNAPISQAFIANGFYDTNQKVSVDGKTPVSAINTQTPTTNTAILEIGNSK